MRRHRERKKGVTLANGSVIAGITPEGVSDTQIEGITVTPEGLREQVPANYGQPDCRCRHCQQTKARRERGMTLNHGAYKTAAELGEHERNRLALPGDVDYTGVAKPAEVCV